MTQACAGTLTRCVNPEADTVPAVVRGAR